MKLLTFSDYEKIVIDDISLIDVRAPVEFEKGAFKNAVNLPIMNDEERRLVGICYKENGNEEAVKLGHELVSGKVREERISAWIKQLEKYPNCIIYCFRGGLRSQIAQQWINKAIKGEIPRLQGGYKAFRNYLIDKLEPSQQKSKPVLVGGCTGAGKTIILKKLENSIDLEGIANHRGSSFGKKVTPQPTQINFENNLAYKLIKHEHEGYRYMILEAEGRNVGKCFLPKSLAQFYKSGDLVIVNASLEQRIQNTMNEYVYESQKTYMKVYEDEGLLKWSIYIKDSIGRLKKRLGEKGYRELIYLFEQAFSQQMNTGSYEGHKKWIEILLTDYYDPMYKYQMKRDKENIVFEGTPEEVLDYLKSNYSK
ncbi:tRNA 2-selenouridine(34) synthase MnmH [Herbivorax sp. ANBcel31]|uniref:tRNA 2-selenouridine(34) synthase MnmH n=1 Tax=Herbivorax sp. ANBcel31 TaxID=3069754 RepID=UPI0027AE8EAF|nr:tRNA 2-selenouridine(34) synthase MnmH [Herbivorax sp. ANBcel31]MDQ2087269.1 tRNA 2-selenouridine(34) synthase MnmH [Herbivorax sp. ANBcel31]